MLNYSPKEPPRMFRAGAAAPGIGFLVIVVVAFVPSVATAQILFGTEDLPELPDDADDVYYMPTSSQTGDYLDLTAAWFEYENATDSIVLTIRTANGETLADSP